MAACHRLRLQFDDSTLFINTLIDTLYTSGSVRGESRGVVKKRTRLIDFQKRVSCQESQNFCVYIYMYAYIYVIYAAVRDVGKILEFNGTEP